MGREGEVEGVLLKSVGPDGKGKALESEPETQSLDLGETILDLCDVESYYGSQGLSLRPILDDPAVELRHELLIETGLLREAAWVAIDRFLDEHDLPSGPAT